MKKNKFNFLLSWRSAFDSMTSAEVTESMFSLLDFVEFGLDRKSDNPRVDMFLQLAKWQIRQDDKEEAEKMERRRKGREKAVKTMKRRRRYED